MMPTIYFVVTPEDTVLIIGYDDARTLHERTPHSRLEPLDVTDDQYAAIQAWQPPPPMSLA